MPDPAPDAAPALPDVPPAAAPAPAARFTLHTSDAEPAAGTPADAAPRTVVLRAEGEEVVIEAARRLTLRVGASALTLEADGTIVLHGVRVTVAGDEGLAAVSAGATTVRGATVDIN